MAGLYLVGAWLVTQVNATLLPAFEAPDWVMKALLALLAIGFFASLVYARAAQIAAIAGERATAMRWRDQAMASPPQSIDQRARVSGALSATARALGDQEAAWQLLAPFAGDAFVLPDAQLRVFKPYYDRLYGESASYRAYMVKIAAGPTPTP
jgi:hypothetical protein